MKHLNNVWFRETYGIIIDEMPIETSISYPRYGDDFSYTLNGKECRWKRPKYFFDFLKLTNAQFISRTVIE